MSSIPTEKLDRILNRVRAPSRYLGLEPNAVRKDRGKTSGSMALVFPDLYDIGMSHLGLKILYHVINSEPDLFAERAFAPQEDMAAALEAEGLPLFSLETKKPLSEFDVVGFTIPYELSYTTILWMLDLAGIPLKAAQRGPGDPLVVGGGAGVYNPEPVAEFFDLFFLGDGERAAPRILRQAAAMKDAPREEVLKKLAGTPGVYVPSLFGVSYEPTGEIERITPLLEGYEKAERVFLPTLSESPYPTELVLPFGQPVQDRLNVEIDRGCTQGCRFCQAGTTYRPVRERRPDEVMGIMDDALARTGYDAISVTSLSAGDYSHIDGLLKSLMDRYAKERISVSMPSLRSATVTEGIIHEVGRVRKTGFTITAEAGSQRLRNVINKKVDDEDILRVASRLLASGWRSLKLYFMIGLPTETFEDIDAIYHLLAKLASLKEGSNKFQNISISVSNFVPKAHTAFQWFGQNTMEELAAKKERIFSLIKRNRRLRLKSGDTRMSHLEAAFSRGDRRLARVVETAYNMGRRLDSWTERFDFGSWMKAFEANGLDSAFYANRSLDTSGTLPWDHIDTGLSKKYFIREWKNALKGEETEDCKTGECLGCGLNPSVCFDEYGWAPPERGLKKPEPAPGEGARRDEKIRYRLAWRKTGLLRFLSHLETKSVLTRALRAAGAPFSYSRGYSPHPRISWGHALPVGVESREEFLDLELEKELDTDDFIKSVNRRLPEGLHIARAERLSAGDGSASAAVAGFRYRIVLEGATPEKIREAVEKFNAAESVMAQRDTGKRRTVDLKAFVSAVEIKDGSVLEFDTRMTPNGAARPSDLPAALFPEGQARPVRVVKLLNIMKDG
ncbi:MAG: TIGR03960 family B12-binding radical SAM protein [Candidatus Nitrospinota bacterium M3_3B_026]